MWVEMPKGRGGDEVVISGEERRGSVEEGDSAMVT
jgi:hypothetical protein